MLTMLGVLVRRLRDLSSADMTDSGRSVTGVAVDVDIVTAVLKIIYDDDDDDDNGRNRASGRRMRERAMVEIMAL